MLNWIVWNRTVWLNWVAWKEMFLTIKLYLHLNCVLMLNWIVWNETAFDIETVLTLIELFNLELFWNLTLCKKNLYLYETELFKLN